MGSARSVTINGLKIGGGAPVRVESMLKSRLTDLAACLCETERLAAAGVIPVRRHNSFRVSGFSARASVSKIRSVLFRTSVFMERV